MNHSTKDISDALDTLRQYCADEGEAMRYHNLLKQCDTAREIADKVIKPLFAAGRIREEEAKREAFYLSLVRETDPKEERIKRNTMYDNVRRVLKEVERERKGEELRYQLNKYSNGGDFWMKTYPDNTVEVVAHVQFHGKNPLLLRLLMLAVRYLQGIFKQSVEKNLDGRAHSSELVYDMACRAEDMPVLLAYMQTLVDDEDFRVTYISPYTEQPDITLDEALEIATTEAKESDD